MNDICSVEDCKNKATQWWPLISGGLGLCRKHYNNPPTRFKELVRKSQEPPDDFDIPYPYDEEPLP